MNNRDKNIIQIDTVLKKIFNIFPKAASEKDNKILIFLYLKQEIERFYFSHFNLKYTNITPTKSNKSIFKGFQYIKTEHKTDIKNQFQLIAEIWDEFFDIYRSGKKAGPVSNTLIYSAIEVLSKLIKADIDYPSEIKKYKNQGEYLFKILINNNPKYSIDYIITLDESFTDSLTNLQNEMYYLIPEKYEEKILSNEVILYVDGKTKNKKMTEKPGIQHFPI
ncbi:hypothetical protein K7I13_03525 [Brucepastera parasyntrophica]|uniref:hypothetical protein n=1 Tax=Brucepastera parasyntrophica TaxID=2880008 RepID=UPI00210F0C12|nr:hypothetical protein [Brucepastera parasyntrophica]ULQ60390.1 hypothetical protein K7I13_03525 [Brucepastera parasyntrophica]